MVQNDRKISSNSHTFQTNQLFYLNLGSLHVIFSIPAGLTRMNMPLFIIFTTIGTLIWNIVLIYLGQAVGGNWHTIVHYMDIYSRIIYIILANL